MGNRHATDQLTFDRYWQEAGRTLATEQLRITCVMLLALQVAFSCLDAFAFPEHFPLFLGARMSVNVLLVVSLLWLRHSHQRVAQSAIALALGAEILLMIYKTGGPVSDYYVGLIILSVGMPVLLPYRRREALGITGSFFVGFLLSPLAVDGDFDTTRFLTALVFIGTGCVECVVSSGILMNARMADFAQRAELEESRDRLAALDEAKARFSANVHHELRTPLTLILAPLDAMRSGELGQVPENLEKTLRTMHINGQRLLKMINNLLDLAKVESQSFEIHRRPMDLLRLLRDLVDGAGDMAARKGIDLRLEAVSGEAEGEGLVVNADPEAVEKVAMNLLGNALKFTESGGRITLRVEGGVSVDGYEGVRVEVVDTGIGLAPEQLARVFDRFSQVDSSATRKHEGTGIGLSLAQEMVELHGGRIWAESEGEGRGASMIFELPVGELDPAAEEEVLCDEEGRGVKLGTSIQAVEADLGLDADPVQPGENARFAEMERSVKRWASQSGEAEGEGGAEASTSVHDESWPEVLVTEDNPDMRQLLEMLVAREFRTRTARNGREALERVAERKPDLVLTDVMMPEMSGTELCRALKADPETREIPVVLVTSKAESEMKVEGLELGADDYVTKPFHPRELMARVRALVVQRRLKQEVAERNAELEEALASLEQAQVQLVQSERLAAVGELAAGVAHEVNNPVNFALNAARTLRASVKELQGLSASVAAIEWGDDDRRAAQVQELQAQAQEMGLEDLTDTVGELSQIISEGLDRTHTLVGDLRDFARPGSRREKGEVELSKSLRSTVQLLQHKLRDARAEVRVDVPPDLPPVWADPGALNQVFLNLIKNSAESFAGGGGTIRVEASAENGTVRVRVADDGCGMSDDVREHLFEPFFTTKESGGGTGLGLSICRQIVEAHQGHIQVESREGEGSVVTLELPVAGGAAGAA